MIDFKINSKKNHLQQTIVAIKILFETVLNFIIYLFLIIQFRMASYVMKEFLSRDRIGSENSA